MVEVRLERQSYTPAGTFGYLWVGDRGWFALEEPWKGNERGRSCIPTGEYDLAQVIHNISTPDGSDDYPAYEVAGVEGRSAIHIHIGNTIEDIEGCILLGTEFRVIEAPRTGTRLPAVLNSRVAFEQFMALMANRPGKIRVVNACPDEFQIDWRSVDA